MSEHESKKRSTKEVRRVTKKDRKRKIETGQLFPPEDDTRFAPPELAASPMQNPAHNPNDDDKQTADDLPPVEYALEELIDDEEEQPTATITVPGDDERFPPINPAALQRPSAAKAQPVSAPPQSSVLPNLLAIIFAFGTIGLIAFFAAVWVDPFSAINPLPPNTPLPIIVTETPPPSATPSPAPTETFTPLPVVALTELAPVATFTPALFPFTLANTGVIYAPNGNGQGCNWSSIAGSVTGLDGRPLDGLAIRITGESVDETVTSGTIAAFGPGSYELFLNGVPQQQPYTLQLFSPQGAPLSEEFTVVTSELCSQNVTIVNFVQNQAF